MAEQEFVIRQTSVEFQNDLDKVERLLEVRSLGVGLRLDAVVKQLSALVTTEENSEAPFEISDDGGYTIFRIDNDGEILTKAFDSREINQILRIYQLGTGLVLNGNTLSVDGSISSLAKIYSIGQGLTLNNQGELFVNNDLYNLAKIYSIRDGLVLDAQGALSALVYPSDTTDGAYEIADVNGNVALRITNEGHLLTKEFDSEEVARLQRIYTIGSGLNLDSSGTLSVTTLGGVTDVRVDGLSVVSNTIANIEMPIKTNEGSGAFEIADEVGNVALQITSEGHIKTKEFDSSNISPNLDFQVVSTLPTPSESTPKVAYNLSNHRLYILVVDVGGILDVDTLDNFILG